MAQIGVQYPGLEGMFKDAPIFGSQLALQQFNSAQDNNTINQAQSIQDMFQQEDMHPLKMQQLGLANQTEEAQLPGVIANSTLLGNKAKVSSQNLDLASKADRAKLMSSISDEDVKNMESLAQMLAYSPDPEISARGQEMLQMHADVLKEKAKQNYMSERQLELEKLRGNNQLNLARENNAAGRYSNKGKSGGGIGGPQGIEAAAASGKLSFEKASVAFQVLADREEDEQLAMQYAQRAQQYEMAAAKQKQAAAQGVQRPDLQGMGIPSSGGQAPVPSIPLPTPRGTPAVEPRADGYTGPGSSPQNPISAEAIKKAFGGEFDPQRYFYRVNPETGKIQRAPRNQ